MTSMDEYLPVPTSRRDENSLPPMTRFVSLMAPPSSALTPAHRSDDLYPVALVQHGRLVRALRRHLAIHGHRGVLPLDAQVRQKPLDAHPVGYLPVLAVDHDLHKQKGRPFTGAAARVSAVVFPSLGLSRSGSRGPGPHPVLRIPPPTTSRRSIPPQASVSRRPGLAITRDSAPSTQPAQGDIVDRALAQGPGGVHQALADLDDG